MNATNDLQRAVEHLQSGGVVAVATETYYTLCADARRPSAVEAVFALKEREETRAAAVLLPAIDLWAPFVREIPPLAMRLATRFWPGPLTIALPAADGTHASLKWRGKVAVRVPGPSPALELARAFGGALTATSANPSGAPSSRSHEDVRGYFTGRPGLLILEGQAEGGMPSTVVEIEGATLRIVRPGAVPQSVLDAAAEAEAAA
ncbi:MAG: threonylcarbamoyl-AMP synthase [Deltaproteobacteria bacterium]|nr:threonylcarbamoyl-AMP synthase [Deltaproteobacteria bacterium]